MLKKHIIFSFVFCTIILSSTLISTISYAVPAAQKTNLQSTQPKTTKQRVVSGLGYTALLVPSLLYIEDIPRATRAYGAVSLAVVATHGFYTALKGIYHVITKSEVAPEGAITLNKWTAAKSALLAPSLIILRKMAGANMTLQHKLFASLPAFYALGTSLRTIHKLAQNRSAHLETQPEIQAITE